MTYLTEPQAGGKTSFVQLGIAAKPVARSAVFWYNHLPSGDSDDLTRHAACPGIQPRNKTHSQPFSSNWPKVGIEQVDT